MRVAVRTTPARRRVYWAIFVALFLLQQLVLWWLYWGNGAKVLAGDEVAYMAWARGLAGLAPMPAPTGWWPPLQAWLLAGLFRLFGENLIVVQIVQSAFMLGAAACLRAIWRRCDGRVRAANIAAALFLLNPSTFAYAHWLWPEPVHLLLLLGALWLIMAGVHQARSGAFAGIALGGALLAKSLLSLFWPLYALLLWRRDERRLAWGGAVALLLGVAVVTAIPLWQGWQLTGKPMIADSSAFNLVGGLSDRWRSDYVDDSVGPLWAEYFAIAKTPVERNALFMQRAHAIVQQRGVLATAWGQLERQYFRLFSAKTLLLSQLPGPACAGYMSSYPAPAAWLSAALTGSSLLLHALTLTGFALGLMFWRRWREPLVWWIALFFAYQLGLYLVLHVKARFLLPMLPFLCAFAGSALASASRPGGTPAVQFQASILRWFGAAGLVALLLGLAFLGPLLDHSCA